MKRKKRIKKVIEEYHEPWGSVISPPMRDGVPSTFRREAAEELKFSRDVIAKVMRLQEMQDKRRRDRILCKLEEIKKRILLAIEIGFDENDDGEWLRRTEYSGSQLSFGTPIAFPAITADEEKAKWKMLGHRNTILTKVTQSSQISKTRASDMTTLIDWMTKFTFELTWEDFGVPSVEDREEEELISHRAMLSALNNCWNCGRQLLHLIQMLASDDKYDVLSGKAPAHVVAIRRKKNLQMRNLWSSQKIRSKFDEFESNRKQLEENPKRRKTSAFRHVSVLVAGEDPKAGPFKELEGYLFREVSAAWKEVSLDVMHFMKEVIAHKFTKPSNQKRLSRAVLLLEFLIAAIEGKQTEAAHTTHKLKNNEKSLTRVKRESTHLQNDLAESNKALQATRTSLSRQKKQSKQITKENEQLLEQVTEMDVKMTGMEKELTRLKELPSLTELETCKDKMLEMESEINELKENATKQKEHMESKDNEYNDLKNRLNSEKDYNASLVTEIRSLEMQRQIAQNHFDELQEKIFDQEISLTSLQKNLKTKNKEIRHLKDETSLIKADEERRMYPNRSGSFLNPQAKRGSKQSRRSQEPIKFEGKVKKLEPDSAGSDQSLSYNAEDLIRKEAVQEEKVPTTKLKGKIKKSEPDSLSLDRSLSYNTEDLIRKEAAPEEKVPTIKLDGKVKKSEPNSLSSDQSISYNTEDQIRKEAAPEDNFRASTLSSPGGTKESELEERRNSKSRKNDRLNVLSRQRRNSERLSAKRGSSERRTNKDGSSRFTFPQDKQKPQTKTYENLAKRDQILKERNNIKKRLADISGLLVTTSAKFEDKLKKSILAERRTSEIEKLQKEAELQNLCMSVQDETLKIEKEMQSFGQNITDQLNIILESKSSFDDSKDNLIKHAKSREKSAVLTRKSIGSFQTELRDSETELEHNNPTNSSTLLPKSPINSPQKTQRSIYDHLNPDYDPSHYATHEMSPDISSFDKFNPQRQPPPTPYSDVGAITPKKYVLGEEPLITDESENHHAEDMANEEDFEDYDTNDYVFKPSAGRKPSLTENLPGNASDKKLKNVYQSAASNVRSSMASLKSSESQINSVKPSPQDLNKIVRSDLERMTESYSKHSHMSSFTSLTAAHQSVQRLKDRRRSSLPSSSNDQRTNSLRRQSTSYSSEPTSLNISTISSDPYKTEDLTSDSVTKSREELVKERKMALDEEYERKRNERRLSFVSDISRKGDPVQQAEVFVKNISTMVAKFFETMNKSLINAVKTEKKKMRQKMGNLENMLSGEKMKSQALLNQLMKEKNEKEEELKETQRLLRKLAPGISKGRLTSNNLEYDVMYSGRKERARMLMEQEWNASKQTLVQMSEVYCALANEYRNKTKATEQKLRAVEAARLKSEKEIQRNRGVIRLLQRQLVDARRQEAQKMFMSLRDHKYNYNVIQKDENIAADVKQAILGLLRRSMMYPGYRLNQLLLRYKQMSELKSCIKNVKLQLNSSSTAPPATEHQIESRNQSVDVETEEEKLFLTKLLKKLQERSQKAHCNWKKKQECMARSRQKVLLSITLLLNRLRKDRFDIALIEPTILQNNGLPVHEPLNPRASPNLSRESAGGQTNVDLQLLFPRSPCVSRVIEPVPPPTHNNVKLRAKVDSHGDSLSLEGSNKFQIEATNRWRSQKDYCPFGTKSSLHSTSNVRSNSVCPTMPSYSFGPDRASKLPSISTEYQPGKYKEFKVTQSHIEVPLALEFDVQFGLRQAKKRILDRLGKVAPLPRNPHNSIVTQSSKNTELTFVDEGSTISENNTSRQFSLADKSEEILLQEESTTTVPNKLILPRRHVRSYSWSYLDKNWFDFTPTALPEQPPKKDKNEPSTLLPSNLKNSDEKKAAKLEMIQMSKKHKQNLQYRTPSIIRQHNQD